MSFARRAPRIALALLGLVACGAGAFTLYRHAAPAPSHAAAQASAGWRTEWTPGRTYTFTFAWSGETQAVLTEASAARVDVTYDVAGRLVASAACDATLGGKTVLALRLAALSRHALKAVSVEAVESDDDARVMLESPRAWGVVGDDGAIARLLFAPDAPRAFRETMTKLVEQMQVTPAGDARTDWSATEPGPNGRAAAMYHADGLVLSRVRMQYESLSVLAGGACAACEQHLSDGATITLDPRGVVAKLDDEESLRLAQRGKDVLTATNKFSLTLLDVARAAAPSDAEPIALGAEERTPGERPPLSQSDEQQVLAHEAAGFTPSSLAYAIDLFTTKGEHVADKTWLVHARAFLILHPEAVEGLGQRLTDTDLPLRGRTMTMQLLAVAGTPRAQEILRGAVDDARRRGTLDPSVVGQLVQKLGVVTQPTAETVAYVRDAYQTAGARGDRTLALSDAATLGAIGGKLAKSDPVAARGIVARLDGDLRAATDTETRRGLVLALRNTGAAGDPQVDADVRALASDVSSDVRSEVARTLGDDPTDGARATLRTLATDPVSTVAENALQALDHDAPSANDLHALAASVLAGQTAQSLDGNVMDFFAGHLDDAADARTVLDFILGRTRNPALARRVRALLDQIAS